MIGLGMLYVPLESVVAVFSVGYVVVCGSIVMAMALSGFLIASRLNMYPVEAAIVTSCHSGLGGRGCGYSLGVEQNGVDAFCSDCDSYRRRISGNYRYAIVELACVVYRIYLPAAALAGRRRLTRRSEYGWCWCYRWCS